MKFVSKYIWQILFFSTAVVGIWIGSILTLKLVDRSRFSEPIVGKSLGWSVLKLSEESYAVSVDYQFNFNNQVFESKYLYPSSTYLTKAMAEDAVEQMQSEEITVWVWNKKNSKPVAVLERKFPKNELIRFIIALCILIYFVSLKYYLHAFAIDR